jgi:hypothetical protein
MKYVIYVDDSTKVGRSLLEIARSMSKLYKSVIVDKVAGSSYSKSHKPNKCTLYAIDEALNGNTQKVEDLNEFFNDF